MRQKMHVSYRFAWIKFVCERESVHSLLSLLQLSLWAYSVFTERNYCISRWFVRTNNVLLIHFHGEKNFIQYIFEKMKYFEWIVPFDWFFDREIDWFVCNVKKKLKLVEISIRSVDHARLQPMKRWRNTMETKWIQQQRQQWRVCAVYAHRTAYTSICVCYNIFLYICILNLKQVRTCFNVNR